MNNCFKIINCVIILGFLFVPILKAEEKESYIEDRIKMVERQIITRGVKDNNVIAAMRKVKRHEFIPLLLKQRMMLIIDLKNQIQHPLRISQDVGR